MDPSPVDGVTKKSYLGEGGPYGSRPKSLRAWNKAIC
jgi:hypothetical protein